MNSGIRKIVPTSRISGVGYEYGSISISIGMPIGLLLSLTYSEQITEKRKGNIFPTSRIGESLIRSRIKNG